MSQTISLSEADIRALANSQSFDRGYIYYNNGYVLDLIRRGDLITAEVEGSQYEPYQIQVSLDESGHIETTYCTCPYD